MKAYSLIDLTFFGVIFLFILLCSIEIIEYIQPYYNLFGVSIFIVNLSIAYFIYKNGGIGLLKSEDGIQQIGQKIHNQQHISQSVTYVKNNRDLLAYGSFIGFFIVIIISIVLDTGILLPFMTGIFFIIFFIVKIFGFTLENNIPKNTFKSANALRFFLLTFGLYIIILTLMLNSFDVDTNARGYWYTLFGALYIIGGGILFFTWNIGFKKIFTVYNSLSLLFLSSLIVFLGFQNGFFNFGNVQENTDIIENVGGTEELVEILPAMEPGIIPEEIISSEANLTENIDNEIIFETERVANIYNIPEGLQLGSAGTGVADLQEVLGKLQYYTGDVDGEFTEETRQSLIQTLRTECLWPESTRGIFGPAAKNCVDNLEITIPVN